MTFDIITLFPDMFKGPFDESIIKRAQDKKLVEVIELRDHPYFIGTQFHPEFQSRPLHPHPLFDGFVKAAKKHAK